MSNSSTSTASNNEMSSAGSRAQSSTPGLHKFSLDLLIRYIENVLSAITNQGLDSTKMHSGTELQDLVQPLASDFSKLLQGISDGAKLFSDQSNFLKSRLSTEAHSVAVDVLKGLGNVHWVAVGLLAIANVLERFDNISANDRECIDLLKDMLKLVKYLKLMRDLKVKFHKEGLDDMREAVQLVLSGAILCRSFIKSNKVSKFLLTKKIRDELVYLRGKVNSMKADLQGHVQLLIMKTLIFITGRNDETDCLEMTEQYQTKDTECEMEQSCETEIDGSEAGNVSSEVQDICNEKDRHKMMEMTLRSFVQLGKFLGKIISIRLGRRPKFSLNLELQMLKEIQQSQIEFNRKELNEATNGFSQKIGEGGFAFVYRGTLSDGRPVAVKTWKSRSNIDPQREWMNELRISTLLQHRNIMQLVGYCSEEDMMLVYDYMPRNLHNVIFGEDEQIIDWPTRHNIILGIIRGLTYLHSGANWGMPVKCIVHRDITPSNILLDVDFNAKICDFGLARILRPNNIQHHVHKEISIDEDILDNMHLTTGIQGTMGYLDPEYFQTNRLTPKSDIYSFGVLLLNIVSGKRPIHYTEDRLHLLSEEATILHKEDRLTELIDPRLINPDGLTNSSTILRTIKIALCCIEREPQRRPSASEVLKMLSSEEEISIPTSPDYHSSKEETPICNSFGKYSITESSSADDISSSPVGNSFLEVKILRPTLPLDLSGTDCKFSQEENWTPNFPPILSTADYNFLEEENWVPTPPIKSFVADDHYSEEKISTHGHSSEEDISIASLLLKSVVVSANSSVQKIGESDTKWSGTSRKALTVTGVFSFVCFIWLLKMLTNVSPL